MKKCISILLAAALWICLAACGSPAQTDSQSPTGSASADAAPAAPKASGSALVLYFSRTGEQYGVGVIDKGNTAIVAEVIADAVGADLYEILPAEDSYPTTYDELTDYALEEQKQNARPAIAGELPDLSGYDTIFIGAPVWWGDWPMILYTVFEQADFSGKTLIPFCTHAGSGLSGFDTKLANACPDSTVLTGLAIAGTEAQNQPDKVQTTVTNWLDELGF